MEKMEKLQFILSLAPALAAIVGIGVAGWVLTTWMRIRNGYPLDGQWGQALYPKRDDNTAGRVTLLTQENAALRAELGAIQDRLANVERIVTDAPSRLAHDIEILRDRAN
jgi:hypothetical protein